MELLAIRRMEYTLIKYYLTEQAIASGCKFKQPRDGDAGWDIHASRGYKIFGNHQQLISTGLHVHIPDGFVGIIKDRSSMALEQECHIIAGVIDSSYRGEVKVLLKNFEYVISINPGARIAQMIIVPIYSLGVQQVLDLTLLDESLRVDGGFGSTGE